MVLIDALYINDGGGKIMLDYLISKLEDRKIECYYLFDERIKNNCYEIDSSTKAVFMKPSLWSRYLFYKRNKDKFEAVFCLANIPPNIEMGCKTITYFHSTLYIQLSVDNTLIDSIKIGLKKFVLNLFLKNSDYWFVQTELMKKELTRKFRVEENKISIMPFYPKLASCSNNLKKDPLTYLYVSLATAHKNHLRLIESFCLFYDKYKKGQLRITVGQEFAKIISLIEVKVKLGYPIENLGFIKRDELLKYYQTSEYLIFPSLTESFGLGLVEAIENGCKVIGANLPYTFAVCNPSVVFDPFSVDSIVIGFEQTLSASIKESEVLVVDKVDEVINFISSTTT